MLIISMFFFQEKMILGWGMIIVMCIPSWYILDNLRAYKQYALEPRDD